MSIKGRGVAALLVLVAAFSGVVFLMVSEPALKQNKVEKVLSNEKFIQ